MSKQVNFQEVRQLLTRLGFQERRTEQEQVVLFHRPSDTIFPFRPYRPDDLVAQAHLVMVRRILDERGLLTAREFDTELSKAPA